MTWVTRDEDETRALARKLAARGDGGDVFLLYGPMGSGKTVFAQGLASAVGVDPRQVQSPTFVLVREHEGVGGRLVHVDLYRLEDDAALASIGLDELLDRDGLKVIEWAERLPAELQKEGRRFRFAVREDGSHTISELTD